MSYYKLIRKPAQGKAVQGRLYLCTGSGEIGICDTMENADYLVPALVYRVAVTQSPRFKRLMPILQQVPNRSGIRIHRGTKPEHSKGCILVPDIDTEKAITTALLKEQKAREEIRLEILENLK